MGDHTETLQIDFDPDQITYDEILQVFWDSHNPRASSWSKQYMNILFFHDKDQEQLTRQTKTSIEKQLGSKVHTEIEPFTNFYLAEDYHQKYYLQKNKQLMKELERDYDSFQDFIDSTTAARLNGYAAGHGDRDSLEKDLAVLGLSQDTADWLRSRIRR